MTEIRSQSLLRETLLSSPAGTLAVRGIVRETLLSSPGGELQTRGVVREVLRSNDAVFFAEEMAVSIIW